MSVIAISSRQTVRNLEVGRQIIHHEGITRLVVQIPDYQVKLGPNTPWHRRGGIVGETACGLVFETHAMREYKFDDKMCQDCFTRHELALGMAYAAAEETAKFDTSDV